MAQEPGIVPETNAPEGRPVERLDVRDLGPPEPLRRTLESLVDLPDGTVLDQRNDRTPKFLYPKLDDRGYRYETVERHGHYGVTTLVIDVGVTLGGKGRQSRESALQSGSSGSGAASGTAVSRRASVAPSSRTVRRCS